MTQALQNCMDLPPVSKKEWHRTLKRKAYQVLLLEIVAMSVLLVFPIHVLVSHGFYFGGALLAFSAIVIVTDVFRSALKGEPPHDYDLYVLQYHAGIVDRIGKPIPSEDDK